MVAVGRAPPPPARRDKMIVLAQYVKEPVATDIDAQLPQQIRELAATPPWIEHAADGSHTLFRTVHPVRSAAAGAPELAVRACRFARHARQTTSCGTRGSRRRVAVFTVSTASPTVS